jgi:hypothetical protein
MKKFLLLIPALLLLGAGCSFVANAPVEGKWQLAFDLPAGWIMAVPYEEDGTVSQEVRRDDSEVWLQDTETLAPTNKIEATKLDSHRALPTEREDLKNGFFRVKMCEEGGACTAGGHGNYDYYLATDEGNYKFEYFGDLKVVEPIIKSAKRVTHYTDVPTIEVQTN